MADIKIMVEITLPTPDAEDAELVWTNVKDSVLEIRAAAQLLYGSGQTSFYAMPRIAVTLRDDDGERELDLDKFTHSNEETEDEAGQA